MGSSNVRSMALSVVVGLFVLMAWTSPSSAQYVDPAPSGGSCAITLPQDDCTPRRTTLQPGSSASLDLWSAWLASFTWRFAATGVGSSSRIPRVRDLPVAGDVRARVKLIRR